MIADEWSNNWDWNDGPVKNENSRDKDDKKEAMEQSKSQLWLDKYQICISPCANLILIAYKKNLLILQSKLDKQNELEYSISSRISIGKDTKYDSFVLYNIHIYSRRIEFFTK